MIEVPLLVFNGALGDTIACLPALVALSEDHGGLEVRGAIGRLGLLESTGAAFRVGSIEGTGWHRLFSPAPSLADLSVEVAGRRVFVPEEPIVVSNLARLGAEVRPYRSLPGPGEAVHFSDHFWRELTGRPGPAPDPCLEGRIGTGRSWVLHPGSGSVNKNRDPEDLAAVLRGLPDPVVVLEGPADREAVAALEVACGGFRSPVARGLDLTGLLHLLRRAVGFIGHDSGPSHVAAALGVPTLALFRSTEPSRWAPRGPCVVVGLPGEPVSRSLERLLDLVPSSGDF